MWPLPLNASWAQLGYVLEEFEDAAQCTKIYSNFYQIIFEYNDVSIMWID